MKAAALVLWTSLVSAQVVIQQTNCPHSISQNTIVAVQSISGSAIVLSCYTLDPTTFSVVAPSGGTPGKITVIGAVATSPAGSSGQIQTNNGSGAFGSIPGVTESYLSFSGNTTVGEANRVSHGLLPKIPGTPGYCLDSTSGQWIYGNCAQGQQSGGSGSSGNASSIGGIFFDGTPQLGYGLIGLSSTAALWQPFGTIGNPNYFLSSSLVGSRSALNFLPGSGVLLAVSDTGSAINAQISIDPSYVVTIQQLYTHPLSYCLGTSDTSSAFACTHSTPLQTLPPATGLVVDFVPDHNSASGAITLSVDTYSASLFQPDGSTNPGAGYFVAGQMYRIWFDGTNWRKAN